MASHDIDRHVQDGRNRPGQNFQTNNDAPMTNALGFNAPPPQVDGLNPGSRSSSTGISNHATSRRGYTSSLLAARDAHRPPPPGPTRSPSPARSTGPTRSTGPAHSTGPARSPGPHGHPSSGPTECRTPNWTTWPEIRIRVKGLPPAYYGTWQVYNLFSCYADIGYINIENWRDSLNALIVFSTMPSDAFWEEDLTVGGPRERGERLQIQLLEPNDLKSNKYRASPVEPSRRFPEKMSIDGQSLDFGFMQSEKSMVVLSTMRNNPNKPASQHIRLVLDLKSDRSKRLDLQFGAISDKTHRVYRLSVPLTSVNRIVQQNVQEHGGQAKFLLINVQDPPKYFRQLLHSEVEATHKRTSTEWTEWPTMWERQTDIDVDMAARGQLPISLVRSNPVVDTGRWLTFRVRIPSTDRNRSLYDDFCVALSDHNIRVISIPDLIIEPRREAVVWKWLDPHKASHKSDLQQMQDDMLHLDFEVRYQLEVCISHHRLNEFNMTKEFIHELSSLGTITAQNLLENVADCKKSFDNPMDIFTSQGLRTSRRRRLPQDCVFMHSVTFTPTTLHVWTPTVEISNRVIRDREALADRFLRVRFGDEDCYSGLYDSHRGSNSDEVYERIRCAFTQGIDIAGRHYEFLASGNSQFREKGAYFYASTSQETAAQIREKLGKFDIINVVAKYAARIGQCFSTTKALGLPIRKVNVQNIPDIERNGFCFTDGVGKMSKFIAQWIAAQFCTHPSSEDFPSLIQFRMGGCKGVLAYDPSLKGTAVQIRPSQRKFETVAEGLEIIQVSTYQSSFLNQQIILVLNALGVPKQVFIDKMAAELKSIDISMTDENAALQHLQKSVDYNHTTVKMASMILDGFMTTQEPFFMSLMQLWRAWCMKALKEKARITVDQGVFLLGCVDETNSLRMDKGELPEIFVQIPDPDNKGSYKAVEKICIIARNPSLHPGDVRVVRAVNCDKLRHLKDVVVLPQRGERDLANMCAGGDLDGDDYLVMWDDQLVPPRTEWNHPPMDYSPPTPVMAVGKVNVKQMNDFFINYIRKDNLGVIAINHRAFADRLEHAGGVKNATCLRLAQLHSRAVDFMKTGVPAEPEEDLYPKKYPHWMNKPAHLQYRSKAVLGLLYDQVERVDFHPLQDRKFDKRILDAYNLDEELLEIVKDLKDEYDADVRRIMAQHGIETEFEVWTAFVMAHTREKNDYKYAEEMGRLASTLKSNYRKLCFERAGLGELEKDLAKIGPLVAAMYTVTSNGAAEYNRAEREIIEVYNVGYDATEADGTSDELAGVDQVRDEAEVFSRPDVLIPGLEVSSQAEEVSNPEPEPAYSLRTGKPKPLISFPWIFASELGRIATRDDAVRPRPVLVTGPDAINKKNGAHRYTGGILDPVIESRMPGLLPEFELPEPDAEAFAAAKESYHKLNDDDLLTWPSSEIATAATPQLGIPATVAQFPKADNSESISYPTDLISFEQLGDTLSSDSSADQDPNEEISTTLGKMEIETGSSSPINPASNTVHVQTDAVKEIATALEEMERGGPSDSSGGPGSPTTSPSSDVDDTIIADEHGKFDSPMNVSEESKWETEGEVTTMPSKRIAKTAWDNFVRMQGF